MSHKATFGAGCLVYLIELASIPFGKLATTLVPSDWSRRDGGATERMVAPVESAWSDHWVGGAIVVMNCFSLYGWSEMNRIASTPPTPGTLKSGRSVVPP
jgi:hypothetical protein